MEIFKNKLFIILLIALAVLAFSYFTRTREQVAKQNLHERIVSGYARQFCAVIYPRLANCVTLPAGECQDIAGEQIAACIEEGIDPLPDTAKPKQAQEIYTSFGPCFSEKMHQLILDEYAIDSEECQRKLK